MPTNPNMVAIQTVTVGAGGASSIEFTSIPQTYTDLVIVCSARNSSSSGIDMGMRFNGNTGTNYSYRSVYGSGSTASSGSASSETLFTRAGYSAGSGYTASTFSNVSYYIPNYTSSNNKSVSIDGANEQNSSTAYAQLVAGLWSQTSAITSVTLYVNSANTADNFAQYSTATLYGVTSAGYGAKATGGIITSDANYYYHTFLASGTFTPTSNITADYLVVAGGAGGGGYYYGAGGGAGGLRSTVTATGGGGSLESALSLTASTNYTVTVGAGGAGGAFDNRGTNGSNSVFSSITSNGGGGGGNGNAELSGASGGSGGGGGASNISSTRLPGSGTANQGYAGGNASSGYSGGASGGGGGAGAVGGDASGTTGGNGGNGVTVAISGSSVTYAGGGGGSTYSGTQGSGGTGGGGQGARNQATTVQATSGTANTGSGGGGANQTNTTTAGAGGSGIVIVRYAK